MFHYQSTENSHFGDAHTAALLTLCLAWVAVVPAEATAQTPAVCTSDSTALCTLLLSIGDPTGNPVYPALTASDCETWPVGSAESTMFPTFAPPTAGGACRVAVVWPGDGREPRPPLIVYNEGSGNQSAAATANNGTRGFQNAWPAAITVYTQATDKVGHNGQAAGSTSTLNALHRDWAPRVPDQEPVRNGNGTLPLGTHTDLPYVDAVLQKVKTLFPYNADNVFAAGWSSGCFFTFAMLEMRASTFAGFAGLGCRTTRSGTGTNGYSSPFGQMVASPRPVLYMMGDVDGASAIGRWTPVPPPICPATGIGCRGGGLDNGAQPFWWTFLAAPPARVTTCQGGPCSGVDATLNHLVARSGATPPINTDCDQSGANPAASGLDNNCVLSTLGVTTLPASALGGADVEFGLYAGSHNWGANPNSTAWTVDLFQRKRVPYFGITAGAVVITGMVTQDLCPYFGPSTDALEKAISVDANGEVISVGLSTPGGLVPTGDMDWEDADEVWCTSVGGYASTGYSIRTVPLAALMATM